MYDKEKQLSKYLFIASFLILSYLAYLLVKPFFGAIIIGLLVSYLIMPLHVRLRKIIRSNKLSAILVTLAVVAIMILSMILLTNLLVNETLAMYDRFNIESVTSIAEKYLHTEKVEQYVVQFAEKALTFFINIASVLLLKIPEMLLEILIAIVVLFFSLKDSEKLKKKMMDLLPVEKEYKTKIVNSFSETMDAVAYSTIVISVAEAIVATIGYFIFGIGTPLFWGFLTLIAAMLPFIGPATVWLPLGIYILLTGNPIAGWGIIVYGALILTLGFENFLRPWLIAKKGKMHPIIVILGVLGGLALFGIAGLILGPFILSIFIFFTEMLFGNNAKIKIL